MTYYQINKKQDTSLKERFTLLSNKNPPERDVFKGNFSTCKTFFLPIILSSDYSANRPDNLAVGFVYYRRIQ